MAVSTSNNSKETIQKHIQKRSLDVKFDLDGTKYQPVENIGIGAYGVVCSAIHKKSKDKVAIKKIPNIFDVLVITKRTHREIKILKHFKHDNIICIREILKPKEDFKDFRDIYVVFDLMESDLHKIIYSDQELSEEHSRYFLYQILRGLKYIHSANVVHRDLKPGNILVNEDCHVRIGDFGMSRGIFASPDEPSHFMTQYVATRWYRAPEILLSLVEYGTAVDMWSVGCIFAEMLGRKHLFPGKDYISQIKLIIGVLGSPSAAVFMKCQNDLIKKIIVSIGPKEPIPWKTLFPKASKKAIDLLGKILVLDPKQRVTVEQAMRHPYLSKYHDPDDEPICVPAFKFDFEKEYMDKDKLRDSIYAEIMDFHKPRTPTLSFSAFIRPAPKDTTNTTVKIESDIKVSLNSALSEVKTEKSSPLIESNTMKKPPDIQTSPASVNVNNLQVLSCTDVEMLSAKSTDIKMETQTPNVPASSTDKENKSVGDNKTISDDTKALIKKALLNGQWRQRNDSTGDKEDKPKVMTAAMRQKERQDKRREKEKLKKLRNKKKEVKQKTEVFLSEADKAMLKRWTEMRKKSEQPILPKPAEPAAVATNIVNVKDLSPPGQTEEDKNKPLLDQPTPQSSSNADSTSVSTHTIASVYVTTVPNALHEGNSYKNTSDPQTAEVSGSLQGFSNSQHLQSSSMQTSTQGRIKDVGEPDLVNTKCQLPISQNQITNMAGYSNQQSSIQGQSAIPKHSHYNVVTQYCTANSSQRQSTDYLMKQQILESDFNCSTDTSSQFPESNNSSFNTSRHSGISFGDYSDPSFNTSGNQSTLSFESNGSFNSLNAENMDLVSLSKDLQSTIKCTLPQNAFTTSQNAARFPNHTPSVQNSGLNMGLSFPHATNDMAHNFNQQQVNPPQIQTQVMTQNPTSFDQLLTQVSNFHDMPTTQVNTLQQPNILNFAENNQFQQMQQDMSQMVTQNQHQFNQASNMSVQQSQGQQSVLPDLLHFTPSNQFPPSQPLSNYNQHLTDQTGFYNSMRQPSQSVAVGAEVNPRGQETQLHNWNPGSQESSASQSPSYKANSPGLKVDCSPPERKLPSPNNSQHQPDLVALLSKKMSKSLLDNILPPALSLTPRGTGAGYGVGMDMDSLLVEAQEVNESHTQSPLSSSLLADWFEISGGNITLADLEDLEEMSTQSPLPFENL